MLTAAQAPEDHRRGAFRTAEREQLDDASARPPARLPPAWTIVGAGTVEFLVSDQEPEKFYFMEMNTRLQVEHPVTEEITGIDLVEQQLRIAAGREPLRMRQDDVVLSGHSVEARIYAEDPQADFLAQRPGTVLGLSEPQGPGVRVDSGMRENLVVGTDYDPMLAKVIATGTDRDQAFSRDCHRALGDTVVHGLTTNTSYLQQLAADPEVRAGTMDTTMIERKLPDLQFPEPQQHHAAAAALFLAGQKSTAAVGGQKYSGIVTGCSSAPGRLAARQLAARHSPHPDFQRQLQPHRCAAAVVPGPPRRRLELLPGRGSRAVHAAQRAPQPAGAPHRRRPQPRRRRGLGHRSRLHRNVHRVGR